MPSIQWLQIMVFNSMWVYQLDAASTSASNSATHRLAKSLKRIKMSLKGKVLLFLVAVCILQQCACFAESQEWKKVT